MFKSNSFWGIGRRRLRGKQIFQVQSSKMAQVSWTMWCYRITIQESSGRAATNHNCGSSLCRTHPKARCPLLQPALRQVILLVGKYITPPIHVEEDGAKRKHWCLKGLVLWFCTHGSSSRGQTDQPGEWQCWAKKPHIPSPEPWPHLPCLKLTIPI